MDDLTEAVRVGLLHREPQDSSQPAWRLGTAGEGALLSLADLRHKREVVPWERLERLELVVEPPPFQHWWSWVLANIVGLTFGGYTNRYGHIRLHVLKRGSAFQATWDLGRTPKSYEATTAEALAQWVASLTNSGQRALVFVEGD